MFDILFDLLLGFQFSRGTFYTKSDPNYTFEKDDEENLGWIIDCSISQNNDTVWFVYFIELLRNFSNASVSSLSFKSLGLIIVFFCRTPHWTLREN